MKEGRIAFCDRVRVRRTDETESRRVVGLTGIVHGRTTPSVTGVSVIGKSSEDIAIGVLLDGQATALWFAEDLLEIVDHAPGTTAEIAGRKFIRDERGEWREIKPN